MITLTDVMDAASRARDNLDKLRDQIDAHESYASINQAENVTLKKNLDTLAKDIEMWSWIMSENRSAMMRDAARTKKVA